MIVDNLTSGSNLVSILMFFHSAMLLLPLLYAKLENATFCFSSFKGREIGHEKLLVVLDLQSISYKNVDARGLITGFQFLQVIVHGHSVFL